MSGCAGITAVQPFRLRDVTFSKVKRGSAFNISPIAAGEIAEGLAVQAIAVMTCLAYRRRIGRLR